MPFDLGDAVTLTFATVSSAGLPANADTIQVTITQPDGSTVGPSTPTATGVGAYAFTFVPTMAGRHLARWTATGAAIEAAGYSDAFDVEPADPGYLISVDDAKRFLRIRGDADDDKLREFVAAASAVATYYCGDLLPQTYTEAHDGGDEAIWLRHTPVQSISSLSEYLGNITYTLTNQPLGQSVDSWGYTLDDPAAGRVVRRSASGLVWRFAPGVQNVRVTYKTGTGMVPPQVRKGVEFVIRHLWATQRGPMPPAADPDSEQTVPGIGYAIPNRAIELFETAPRLPVVA